MLLMVLVNDFLFLVIMQFLLGLGKGELVINNLDNFRNRVSVKIFFIGCVLVLIIGVIVKWIKVFKEQELLVFQL